jgi:prephenate dehydrogenase
MVWILKICILATIYGIDTNEKHLDQAIELGVIDEVATFADLMH